MSYKNWVAHVRTVKGENGSGLAIGPRHVLTSAHVLDGSAVRCRFPRQAKETWFNFKEVWASPKEKLDVALLQLVEGQDDLKAPVTLFRHWVGQDERWSTEGFPRTGKVGVDAEDRVAEPVSGSTQSAVIGDEIVVLLTDTKPADRVEDWSGLSGAPVMMREGTLAGVIREVAARWDRTLRATPVSSFWGDAGFQKAYGEERVQNQVRKARELFYRRLEELLEEASVRADLADSLGIAATSPPSDFRVALLGLELLIAVEAIQAAHHRATSSRRQDAARTHGLIAQHLLPVASATLDAASAAFQRAEGGVATILFATPLMAEALSAALDGQSARLRVKGPEVVGELLLERPGMSGLVPATYFHHLRNALIDQYGPRLDRQREESEDQFRRRQDAATNDRLAASARRAGGRALYFCVAQHGEPSAEPETRRLLRESFPALRLIELGPGAPGEQDLVPLLWDMLPASRDEDDR